MARPSRAIINLPALRHNYRLAQALSGAGKAMPIVKADAYGHGAVHVAKALEAQAPAFGVACIEEAMELRDAGIAIPILLLEGFFSTQELMLAAERDFWLMIQTDWQLQAVCNTRCSKPLVTWLKIDTGMHRLGFQPERARDCHHTLQCSPQVADEVVLATHFSSADDLRDDSTRAQIELFQSCTGGIAAPRSLSNSPALLGWPDARAEWNRPGFMLYGNSPFSDHHPLASKLRPVMNFCSQVMALRDVPAGEAVGYGGAWTAPRASRIAVVPVGYGDGYPRHAENGTPVLINGQRAKLAGRVSMDMITVDVTDLGAVTIGDEVTLWGENPSANEIATHADTIGYELVARMPGRVPRVATENG